MNSWLPWTNFKEDPKKPKYFGLQKRPQSNGYWGVNLGIVWVRWLLKFKKKLDNLTQTCF